MRVVDIVTVSGPVRLVLLESGRTGCRDLTSGWCSCLLLLSSAHGWCGAAGTSGRSVSLLSSTPVCYGRMFTHVVPSVRILSALCTLRRVGSVSLLVHTALSALHATHSRLLVLLPEDRKQVVGKSLCSVHLLDSGSTGWSAQRPSLVTVKTAKVSVIIVSGQLRCENTLALTRH